MWYKVSFTILFASILAAVLFGVETWPLSHYPMYGGKKNFHDLGIYTWKITDAKGVTTSLKFRHLPVLSSFSMSLEEMQEAQVDKKSIANFINRYIDSELQMMGIKSLVNEVAVYGYNVTKNMNEDCYVKMANPELCVKEQLIFKRNATQEIFLR